MPNDLTLAEKTRCAEYRAREEVAEKHFFDLSQPFFPLGFTVIYRNPGHWDVIARQVPGKVAAFLSLSPGNSTSARDGESERAFRIRGEPGNVIVLDERWNPHRPSRERQPMTFRSVIAAMVWICDELMQEPPQAA